MEPAEKLELIATLRRGNCQHPNRVNICTECLARLEKIVTENQGLQDKIAELETALTDFHYNAGQ